MRNVSHDFFGVSIAVPLFDMTPAKKLKRAAEDSEMNSASVSQPSVSYTASLYQNSVRDAASAAAQEDSEMNNTDNPYGVDWGDDARSSLPDTASVSQPSARVAVSWAFDAIVEDMKDWYSWAKTIG